MAFIGLSITDDYTFLEDGSADFTNLAVPTGTQDGDIVIVGFLISRISSMVAGELVTWTPIPDGDTIASTTYRMQAYYRVAASEPATYSFTSPHDTGDCGVAFMATYRDVTIGANIHLDFHTSGISDDYTGVDGTLTTVVTETIAHSGALVTAGSQRIIYICLPETTGGTGNDDARGMTCTAPAQATVEGSAIQTRTATAPDRTLGLFNFSDEVLTVSSSEPARQFTNTFYVDTSSGVGARPAQNMWRIALGAEDPPIDDLSYFPPTLHTKVNFRALPHRYSTGWLEGGPGGPRRS